MTFNFNVPFWLLCVVNRAMAFAGSAIWALPINIVLAYGWINGARSLARSREKTGSIITFIYQVASFSAGLAFAYLSSRQGVQLASTNVTGSLVLALPFALTTSVNVKYYRAFISFLACILGCMAGMEMSPAFMGVAPLVPTVAHVMREFWFALVFALAIRPDDSEPPKRGRKARRNKKWYWLPQSSPQAG